VKGKDWKRTERGLRKRTEKGQDEVRKRTGIVPEKDINLEV